MKKLFVFLFFVALVYAGFLFFNHRTSSPLAATDPLPSAPPKVTQTTTKATFGTPVRFQIPKLGIDTTIEEVGMDAKGNMDVPKNADNVAWYDLGYKIGSNGSAVIAAHYDKVDGSAAVFYHLANLTTGDTVKVTDDQGNTLTYTVTDSEAYPFDNFPLQQVFNTKGTPRLNLITCDGTWERSRHTYDKRLVVYTKLTND